jgi:ADP-ribose pyrophosphatase YjhB (NUDIX family)
VSVIDRIYRLALWFAYRLLRLTRRFRSPLSRGAYVAVWSGGRLLLIQNSYKAGETLPAGGLKRGESHRAAARRELREEVGIDIPEDQLEFACELAIQGRYGRDCCHFFELHLEKEPEVTIDRREVVWSGFCPEAELPERPLIPMVRSYLKKRSGTPGPVR